MSASSKARCVLYAAIAVIALIATWTQNVAYLDSPATFLPDFLGDLMASAASRSFTADLVLLTLAVVALMVTESRRLGVRHVWAYIVGGLLIAISVTFPIFLIAREIRISKRYAVDAL